MCDHELGVEFEVNGVILCFRHAVIAAVKGDHVETTARTYEARDCETCEEEYQAKRAEQQSENDE